MDVCLVIKERLEQLGFDQKGLAVATEVTESADSWAADDPDLVAEVEDALAVEAGLAAGDLLLDFPTRSSMLAVDLPLRTRAGDIEQLTDEGRAGQLGLPRVADELYRSARRLRIFTSRAPAAGLDGATALLRLPADEVRARLAAGRPLLSAPRRPARPTA